MALHTPLEVIERDHHSFDPYSDDEEFCHINKSVIGEMIEKKYGLNERLFSLSVAFL